MNRSIFFLFPVLLLLVTSCASLKLDPPSPDKPTILILPFSAKNTSGSPYGYYYKYEIVKGVDKNITHKATFKLPDSNKFLLLDTLSPGTYYVKKVTTHTVGTGRRDYKDVPHIRYDRINLVNGKISIFRNSINFTQKPYGTGGSWVSNYRISSVGREQQAEILKKLEKLENFDKWEVLDTLLTVQGPPAEVPNAGDVVARFPEMSVGDTWVMSHQDDIHGTAKFTYKVTSVESDGSFDTIRENDKDKNRRFKHFDSKAPWVPMFMGLQFDPQALQFPLYVGKAWETETEAPSVDGDYFTYNSKYVVEDYTTVKTDVGVFKAFPIKVNTKNLDTYMIYQGRYWYAPAAKAIVKSAQGHTLGVKLLEMDLVE